MRWAKLKSFGDEVPLYWFSVFFFFFLLFCQWFYYRQVGYWRWQRRRSQGMPEVEASATVYQVSRTRMISVFYQSNFQISASVSWTLFECSNSNKAVEYFPLHPTQQEREHYEYILIDGKIVHKQCGELLDTNRGGSHKAKWIFVVSTLHKLYAGEVRYWIRGLLLFFNQSSYILHLFSPWLICSKPAEEKGSFSPFKLPCWRSHIGCWKAISRTRHIEGTIWIFLHQACVPREYSGLGYHLLSSKGLLPDM